MPPPLPQDQDTAEAEARPYALEQQVGFLLRRAQQRHLALFNAQMAEDLTPQQFAALAKVAEGGPISQNALGRRTAMDQSTINGVVRRLLVRGLLAKGRDVDDRRLAILALTAEGRRVLARVLPLASDITEATLAPLGEADRRTLLRLLRAIG
jgi:DNA-binding MarR family transcriptional regulator